MQAELYNKISSPFRKNEKLLKALNIINTVLTLAVYISYPVLLCVVFFLRRDIFLITLLVPFISFVAVSAVRRIINRPRPYETLSITPLIKKDKVGESMPSRHVFSVFVIAFAFMYLSPLLSIPFFAIGVIMAVIRVVGGVHYLSDVIVGAVIGIASGAVGFLFI